MLLISEAEDVHETTFYVEILHENIPENYYENVMSLNLAHVKVFQLIFLNIQ